MTSSSIHKHLGLRERGLSLVEMMIGITLGLMVVATVSLLFVNNSRARQETEKTSQQIENGRYATQLLVDDLRLAGSYGEFNPSSLTLPGTMPDPSATDSASLTSAITLPVQGYDSGTGMPGGLTAVLTDRRINNLASNPDPDVLVIRRAGTCVAGATGCDAADTTKYTYFQTSLCNTQLSTLALGSQFVIGTSAGTFSTSNPALVAAGVTPLYLAKKDCVTAADLRTYYTRIYFIANNNRAGDGIPTLKVAELGAGTFTITPLVAGIEQMQVEYGLDTDADGEPNSYTPSPLTPAAWRQVTAVKVHLLARNTQTSANFTDTRTYVLGAKADGSDNTVGPFNDHTKRHVYTSVVRLNNVAGRLE